MTERDRPHERGVMKYPRGWRKFFFKMPILWWRLGLGRLLGRYFVVLTTTGRKSGRPRRVMLDYFLLEGKIYVASGWGDRTQWYKNILADPRAVVQTGTRAEAALAHRVTQDEELARIYHAARGRSPAWKRYLNAFGIQDDVRDFVAKKDRLCIVRFDPTPGSAPPRLRADLAWVWLVVLFGGLAIYGVRSH